MLTFTKTKNTCLPDSVHNAGVTLQSRDIPHTLPSPIFYERAHVVYQFCIRRERKRHCSGIIRCIFQIWT
jgi:hypothetical protein